jgi:phage-related minor tail protein
MSKKTVWDLSLEIASKDKGASAALRQVQKNIKDVQEAGKQLGKDFKNFAQNAGKLALGVVGGVAAVSVATLKLAGDFAAAGDQAAKTADALGMGIEGYQRLRYAMSTAGVEAGEFDNAIKKMSNTINMGAAGNEASAKQLAEIGLSAQKLATMKPEKAFERISDYMQTLSSDAERSRVAITLFGKTAGPKMMNAMRMGSDGLRAMGDEAQSLGIIISEEQARASENYVSAMSRMQSAFGGLKNQFIGGAIGPITQAFDHLKDAMVEQGPLIKELGQKFGNFLANAVQKLPEIITKIKEFGTWVKDTANKIAGFVGGWKNVTKILAGLAIAPTLISGLKTVFSLGHFIRIAIGAIGPILGGLSGGFGALAAAALPVIAIIAGIALVIYTVVKNFDTLKQYALDCIERIKSAFSGGTSGIAVDWQKVGETVKSVLGVIIKILEGGVLFAIKTLMNVITSAIQIVVGAFKVLWNVVKLILWPIETIVKVIIALFTGGWSGAIETLKGQFGKLGEIYSGIFDGIKVIIGGVVDFFTNYFRDGFAMVSGIINGLADKFGGVFEKIRGFVESFVNFFTSKFQVVKNIIGGIGNFFGGIGNKIGNFFGGGKNAVPGHAEGGIFTHRHIAEIAERGAEAVVPLNNSLNGFDIWKKAGEIGGYVNQMSQQTSTASTSGTPPVMQAAAQRISGGENIINVNFSQNNTFNGGTPDKETVSQISAAGEQAAEDFEARVKQALDNILRNQKRVSYV